MQKRLHLFVVFLLFVQIWTEKLEVNASSGNYERVTSNVEVQKTPEVIQENNDSIEFKLKQKDDTIVNQEALLKHKSKLLDIEINETSKAKQEASDFKLQIEGKERELQKLQATLNNYNSTISKLESENKQINQEKDELISQSDRLFNERKELESEIFQTLLNHSSLSDENFKKYQRDQESLLESCQLDLKSQQNETIYIRHRQIECEQKLQNKQSLNTDISTLKKKLDDCQNTYKSIKEHVSGDRFLLRGYTRWLKRCNSSINEITNKINCLKGEKCIPATTTSTTTFMPIIKSEEFNYD
ncbi:golgin subfamily A member 4-like [Drosophila sulfurigaster albostrigata]|uniref:golgin subfamily A member 4-like n=1 Tax=Drosophila sulfurigaster albostrigata TaxID=89887 RepID=UPI002D218528|nr:golgin subfamily A member 4-like [Drosophila sulfurigaster albostrigata]